MTKGVKPRLTFQSPVFLTQSLTHGSLILSERLSEHGVTTIAGEKLQMRLCLHPSPRTPSARLSSPSTGDVCLAARQRCQSGTKIHA